MASLASSLQETVEAQVVPNIEQQLYEVTDNDNADDAGEQLASSMIMSPSEEHPLKELLQEVVPESAEQEETGGLEKRIRSGSLDRS